MNDTAKKVGLIVVIVAAVVAAVFGAMKAFGEEKVVVEKEITLPPGSSEKEKALAGSGAGATSGGEADLGGSLAGGGEKR